MSNDPLNTVIIDYGLGNLSSIVRACKSVGLAPEISSSHKKIQNADILILPGVGSFGNAVEALNKLDLIAPVKDYISSGKVLLAICLGMQLLLSYSKEFGRHDGLEIIDGYVDRFPNFNDSEHRKIRVPHVGWSRIMFSGDALGHDIFRNINNETYMYFVHSYFAQSVPEENILTKSVYEGIEFTSGIYNGNVFGFQFHPEISDKPGINFYSNIKNIAQKHKGNE